VVTSIVIIRNHVKYISYYLRINVIILKASSTFKRLIMKDRKKAFLKNLLIFMVFLIGTVFSIVFLVVREFENWVEYQISISIMVTIILFMGFFFFSALHYVIRKG